MTHLLRKPKTKLLYTSLFHAILSAILLGDQAFMDLPQATQTVGSANLQERKRG